LKTTSPAWREARLDFFHEGIFKGTVGVTVEMTGAPVTYDNVTALMIELQSLRLPRSRIVRFVGTLSDGDVNFVLLVRSLFDYEYKVQCVVPNGKVFSWQQWVSWIIIATSDRVVLTMCNEVWYSPAADALSDVVHAPQATAPFLFLCGRHSSDVVLKFMCETQQAWALI
jgi:hypothetical protein